MLRVSAQNHGVAPLDATPQYERIELIDLAAAVQRCLEARSKPSLERLGVDDARLGRSEIELLHECRGALELEPIDALAVHVDTHAFENRCSREQRNGAHRCGGSEI